MTKHFNPKLMTACMILAGFSFSAHAATQGTLGSTSTGSANISITKSVQAQISDLSDMTLPNYSIGQGTQTLYSNVCVYSSTGNYKVTATGSGTSSAFTIASGSNTLPYTVAWNSGGVGNLANTGTAVVTNVQTASIANATTTSATCSGGGAGNDTARVIVTLAGTSLDAAASSATPYTGTLTMLVTPY